MITHGINDTRLDVAGVKLMKPRPDEDGKFYFRNPFSHVRYGVKNEKAAAAVEYLYGAAALGVGGSEIDRLRQFVLKHEPDAYFALVD